jgi:DNA-binding CsgD family transcriptional regulator
MDRLTSKQLRKFLNFLRGSYACHDQEAVVTHLIRGISRLIPSEVTAYAEVDLGSGRLLETSRVEPADADFPGNRQIFERHMAGHSTLAYFQQTGDGHAVKVSDFLTQRQFHRTGLYHEFYRPLGVEDQMTTVLAVRPPLLIGFGLYRSRRDFTERDRLLLNLLRPHLAQAYANAQAVSAMRQEVSLSRQALETNGQGVVVLTTVGQVRLMTARARDWLATYFGPPARDAERLPEAVRAWITHQEAALGRADDVPRPREPLRVERDGTCLVVRHLCETDHCLLLLEERQTARAFVAFAQDGLTQREGEVLQWVAQGKTNAEIGCILDMSTRTAGKHLEHIFEKLGVETRMAAVTVALNRRSGV